MTGKKLAMVLGVIFLLLGLLGLFGGMGIVGEEGAFMTDGAHDWVHLITGLILILVSWKAANSSAMVLKVFGVIYILVAILGFVSGTSVLGIIAVNGAGNILHLILGIILLGGGFMAGKNQMSGGGM